VIMCVRMFVHVFVCLRNNIHLSVLACVCVCACVYVCVCVSVCMRVSMC
jgi:hypothetical protein